KRSRRLLRRPSATPCGTSLNAVMDHQYVRSNRMVSWEESMSRFNFLPLLAFCALVAVLAFAVSDADARAGRGGSVGSRGSQTLFPPAAHGTATTRRTTR